MKVIEKSWKYGTYLAYTDIDEEFLPLEKGVRVLPAPFFYDKKVFFTLHKRYLPGENVSFPNGGYEIKDMTGGTRSYDLDQLIIHPIVLQHKKMLEKMKRKVEKSQKQLEREQRKRERDLKKQNENKTGKRGRPALSAEEKAKREVAKLESKIRSGGKRGRPKSNTPKTIIEKTNSGKRGRPALSTEEKAVREQAKIANKLRTGGKRGRPRKSK
jgi:hypothetical protein